MMRIMLMALFCANVSLAANAASMLKITGKVMDSDQNPVPYAMVSIHLKKDSSFLRATGCDDSGIFHLELDLYKTQHYFLEISMTFFQSQFVAIDSNLSSINHLDLGNITLESKQHGLSELEISGRKSFLERKSDRFVMNIDQSIIAAGNSAFEVLEKAPGVSVNYQDAITMRGKSGVLILIDGKQSPMSAADLANYLKALPASSLDRIEIITNPSAKYDAAGNAGIIDIRLKKDQRFGTNGSFSANYGQGVYPKAGAGFNVNHRNKNWNIFGNLNYNYRKGLNKLNLYREFFENGQRTSAYDQQNYLIFPFNLYSGKLGADYYFPDSKTIIGFVASASLNQFNPRGQNRSDVENEIYQKISKFNTSNQSYDKWPSYSINFNARHNFSAASEINLDVDYANFSNATTQNFITNYLDTSDQKIAPDYYLFGDLKGKLSIQSVKVDYSKSLSSKSKLEAGAKSSRVHADNDLAFFDKSNSEPVYDSTKSNHFLYFENINAVYINYHHDWNAFQFQAGIRAEQTISEGNQVVYDQNFRNDYINLFPSLFLNYKLSEKYAMALHLSRRLDRPNYKQLNPFKFFLDPSTYKEGNPYLNPQFSWIIEWSHTLINNSNISLSYTSTTDNITEVIGPVEGQERITVQTDRNLARFENYSVNANTNLNILKNWSGIIDATAWYGKYTGQYANTLLRDGNLVLNISFTNTINVAGNWLGEFSLRYQTPQVYAFMNLETMWGINLGIQKQFFDKKASIKLSATDIFWTNLPKATIKYRDYIERFDVKRETRQINLSFNYRFGNTKVSASRNRSTGADDEKKRAAG